MAFIDVSISIVSYNSKNVLKNCIESIIKTTQEMKIEIIIVDNNSEDGSSDFVKVNFPGVKLIENQENLGFGKAHNQAFKISKGKYFLILNPDTIIFPHAIQNMLTFMDSHQHVGVAGCKIYWDDQNNFLFPDLRIHSLISALFHFTPFCRYFPNSKIAKWYWKSAYQVWNANIPIKVEGVTGGIMLVRREAFISAGLFDEQFFLFFEEHDLLKRMISAGWEIYYVPDAKIQHYFQESCRKSSFDIGTVYMQSALYYYKKHFGITGYYFLKLLIKTNKIIQRLESHLRIINVSLQNKYVIEYPENGAITLHWHSQKKALKYLIEISYLPDFCDRGGMYVKEESVSLNSDILNKLPNKTGFIRIIPVYSDNSPGKVLKVIKITSH